MNNERVDVAACVAHNSFDVGTCLRRRTEEPCVLVEIALVRRWWCGLEGQFRDHRCVHFSSRSDAGCRFRWVEE